MKKLIILFSFVTTVVFSQVTIIVNFHDVSGSPVNGCFVKISGTGVSGQADIINGLASVKLAFRSKFSGNLKLQVFTASKEPVNILTLKGVRSSVLSFPFEYTGISKVNTFYLNADSIIGTSKSSISFITLDIKADDLKMTVVSSPKILPAGGLYTKPLAISIVTETENAVIKYTFNGSDPSGLSSIIYSGPFTLQDKTILRACAQKRGYTDSPVITEEYTFNFGPCRQPVIEPGTGTYSETLTVTITTQTQDASIKYIIDGNENTYTGPITVSVDKVIKAYAFKNNYENSSITEAVYSFVSTDSNFPDINTYSHSNEIIESPDENSPEWIVCRMLQLGMGNNPDNVNEAMQYLSYDIFLYNNYAVNSFKNYNWTAFIQHVGRYVLNEAIPTFKITRTDINQSADSLKYFIYSNEGMAVPISLKRESDGCFKITEFGL